MIIILSPVLTHLAAAPFKQIIPLPRLPQIVDVNNGSRFETYTICGKRGSGMICLNGAAARCVSTGDKVIIMCYANYEAEEAKEHKPKVVFVDDENKISRVTNYEKHGLLKDQEK